MAGWVRSSPGQRPSRWGALATRARRERRRRRCRDPGHPVARPARLRRSPGVGRERSGRRVGPPRWGPGVRGRCQYRAGVVGGASSASPAFAPYVLPDVRVDQVPLAALFAVLRAVKDGESRAAEALQRLCAFTPWGGGAIAPVSKRLLAIAVGARTLAMAQGLVPQVVGIRAPGGRLSSPPAARSTPRRC